MDLTVAGGVPMGVARLHGCAAGVAGPDAVGTGNPALFVRPPTAPATARAAAGALALALAPRTGQVGAVEGRASWPRWGGSGGAQRSARVRTAYARRAWGWASAGGGGKGAWSWALSVRDLQTGTQRAERLEESIFSGAELAMRYKAARSITKRARPRRSVVRGPSLRAKRRPGPLAPARSRPRRAESLRRTPPRPPIRTRFSRGCRCCGRLSGCSSRGLLRRQRAWLRPRSVAGRRRALLLAAWRSTATKRSPPPPLGHPRPRRRRRGQHCSKDR
jgi:hypothetical protein